MNLSFFMPAFNCADTVAESVESIMAGNFTIGDELVVVDDGSTDATSQVLEQLQTQYPDIRVLNHGRNKGGAAARNTAIDACTHPLLFCLDSDNALVPGSIPKLQAFLESGGADAVYFEYLHYFQDSTDKVTDIIRFTEEVTLETVLSGARTVITSGNYMFTKESWQEAGGYPEFTWLDTWGFGVRQAANGFLMLGMPNSHYFHRTGHESYYVREAKGCNLSLEALPVLIPYFPLIDENDIDYIMGPEGRYDWLPNLRKRPIRLRGQSYESEANTQRVGVEDFISQVRSSLRLGPKYRRFRWNLVQKTPQWIGERWLGTLLGLVLIVLGATVLMMRSQRARAHRSE